MASKKNPQILKVVYNDGTLTFNGILREKDIRLSETRVERIVRALRGTADDLERDDKLKRSRGLV
jgi:hypothetical protein